MIEEMMNANQAMMKTNQEKMEDMESKVEHWEVPKEDAIGKLVKGWKKWHRGQKLAAGRCGEPKELTQGDCGSQKKLSATCRRMSRCARGMSSGKFGPREIVDSRVNWPPPE
jgi:hypothetical protein